MIPFNFHHLYYFYSVTRHGSISKAAKELRISQPALSTQIKRLESYLNVRLFEREKRKISLTEEGHTALSYAVTIFDAGQEFLDNLRDGSGKERPRIQIGVTNSVGKLFASALIKHVLHAYPGAHILLREDYLENMVKDLKDHSLDIILSDIPYQASAEERVRNQLVGKIPVVFCCHPKYSAHFKRFPENMQNAPLILPTTHSGIYRSLQEFFSSCKITPRIVAEIQDTELIHRMALDGIGIAPLNKYSAEHGAFKRKLVVFSSPSKDDIHETIYLIWKDKKRQNLIARDISENFKIRI